LEAAFSTNKTEGNKMTFKPKEGMYCKTRGGLKVGPLTLQDGGSEDYFRSLTIKLRGMVASCWYLNGSYYRDKPSEFDLICEWEEEPKLWKDMTPEEKGALLLAEHEGEQVEMDCSPVRGQPKWVVDVSPTWIPTCAYRVKPEPTVETVTLFGKAAGGEWSFGSGTPWRNDTHKITLTIRDGVVDEAAKVEKL
jgi:hypothetical protein